MSRATARHAALPASGGEEPVMDSAAVGRYIYAAAPLLVAVLAGVGVATADETGTGVELAVGVVGAVGALVNFVVPRFRARRIRDQVIPAERVLAYQEAGGRIIAGPRASAPNGTFVTVERADDGGAVTPLVQ